MNPKNNVPPVHPGEFLKENLDELRISQAEFARTIGHSAMRISRVVHEREHPGRSPESSVPLTHGNIETKACVCPHFH
jgi:hypothetical protein